MKSGTMLQGYGSFGSSFRGDEEISRIGVDKVAEKLKNKIIREILLLKPMESVASSKSLLTKMVGVELATLQRAFAHSRHFGVPPLLWHSL
jgi:hypothetical protein